MSTRHNKNSIFSRRKHLESMQQLLITTIENLRTLYADTICDLDVGNVTKKKKKKKSTFMYANQTLGKKKKNDKKCRNSHCGRVN